MNDQDLEERVRRLETLATECLKELSRLQIQHSAILDRFQAFLDQHPDCIQDESEDG